MQLISSCASVIHFHGCWHFLALPLLSQVSQRPSQFALNGSGRLGSPMSRDGFHEMVAADWPATGKEIVIHAERENRKSINHDMDP